MAVVVSVFMTYKLLDPAGYLMALPPGTKAMWMMLLHAGDVCIIGVSLLTISVLKCSCLRGFAVQYFDSVASFWYLSPLSLSLCIPYIVFSLLLALSVSLSLSLSLPLPPPTPPPLPRARASAGIIRVCVCLCVCRSVVAFMGFVWGDAMSDMQSTHSFNSSSPSLGLDSLPLERWNCTDHDPVRSWLNRSPNGSPICMNSNVKLVPIYLGFMLCRSALHVNPWHSAVCLATSVFGYYMIFVAMKGHSRSVDIAATALLLIGGGALDTMQCYYKLQARKNEFSSQQRKELLTRKRKALLHTLIPSNVLETMSQSARHDSLCSGIDLASIMFCSVEFAVTTEAQILKRAFAGFKFYVH